MRLRLSRAKHLVQQRFVDGSVDRLDLTRRINDYEGRLYGDLEAVIDNGLVVGDGRERQTVLVDEALELGL